MGHNKYTIHIAPKDYEQDLEQELLLKKVKVLHKYGSFFVCEEDSQEITFAQDTWRSAQKIQYESISDAVKKLKAYGNRWAHYSLNQHRRGELIVSSLHKVKLKNYNFLEEIPSVAFGSFSLLSDTEIFFSTELKTKVPFGEINFVEDKINPPSRAYLKLWELFTLYSIKPNLGQKVMDVGSCPGGWTWVLQQIGCDVISVDKAPLDPKIAALPRIEFKKESAFGLRPNHVGKVDWFFSDIICYPEKLYELVLRFKESGLVDNFVCTIKFQRPTDFETLFKFEAIPGSRIIHLSCNKHEVTWINLKC